MGVYKRQGIFTTLIIYAGFVFGAINTIILAPKLLSVEENGIYRLFITVATILSQLLILGSGSGISKFSPYFTNKNHLLSPILLVLHIVFFVYAICCFIFVDPIQIFFPETFEKIKPYYFLLILNVYILILLYSLSGFCVAIFETALGNFFKEFLYKLVASLAFIAVIIMTFDFTNFIKIYTLLNILIIVLFSIVLLVFYNVRIVLTFPKTFLKLWRDIASFSLYSFFTTAASLIILQIDILMVNKLAADSVKSVAIYSTAFFIATVIQTPQRSLAQISTPLFAKLWHDNNLQEIQKNYIKTTLVQMLAGSLLFILIAINIDNIYTIMPSVYGNGKTVVFIILLAKFIEMASGSNAEILGTSKYFKLNFYMYFAMLIILIILNFILIPKFDIAGAALGTLCTALFFNISRYFFLKIKFGFTPFNLDYVKGFCIGIFVGLIAFYLPKITPFYFDVIYRSITAVILYFLLIYYFNISTDINQLIQKIPILLKQYFK